MEKSMLPRIALGIWLAVALLLTVAAICMCLFKLSSARDLGKRVAAAIFWPVLLFSAPGRQLLISIIKDTQT
jgi:hypothetical protein